MACSAEKYSSWVPPAPRVAPARQQHVRCDNTAHGGAILTMALPATGRRKKNLDGGGESLDAVHRDVRREGWGVHGGDTRPNRHRRALSLRQSAWPRRTVRVWSGPVPLPSLTAKLTVRSQSRGDAQPFSPNTHLGGECRRRRGAAEADEDGRRGCAAVTRRQKRVTDRRRAARRDTSGLSCAQAVSMPPQRSQRAVVRDASDGARDRREHASSRHATVIRAAVAVAAGAYCTYRGSTPPPGDLRHGGKPRLLHSFGGANDWWTSARASSTCAANGAPTHENACAKERALMMHDDDAARDGACREGRRPTRCAW